MDIAALSSMMSRSSLATSVTTALTKNAMDVAEQQMQGVVNMMQQASPPSFGHVLDIRA